MPLPFYLYRLEVTVLENCKKIALVGNPNCGKSSLFNLLTGGNEYVGNRPGVTVAAKEGLLKAQSDIVLADTPGVYSLSPFSPDEKATRAYLEKEKVDVIINLSDSRNLRRSLYLTTQVLEMGIPVILALNKFDETESADAALLSVLLDTPTININAKSGTNVPALIEMAVGLIGSKKKILSLFENKP